MSFLGRLWRKKKPAPRRDRWADDPHEENDLSGLVGKPETLQSFARDSRPNLAATSPSDTRQKTDIAAAPPPLVLSLDDIVAEADVYWTYGRFHEAAVIYQWWLSAEGMGTPYSEANATFQKTIAHRAIDSTVQAQDFQLCEDILQGLENAKYPESFLAEQGMLALHHDPGNFFLIDFCNTYEKNPDAIERIIQKMAIRLESSEEKKAKLWKRNRTDANRIAATDGKSKVSRITWNFCGRGEDLLTHTLRRMEDDDVLRYASIAMMDVRIDADEAAAIGNLAGTALLEDDAGGLCPELNEQIFEAVFAAMRKEAITRPQNLGIQVEMLRVLHDEGRTLQYAQWLFHLSVVLFHFQSGAELKRRLLAAGKLLGSHPVWDALSAELSYERLRELSKHYDLPMPAKIGFDMVPHADLVLEHAANE